MTTHRDITNQRYRRIAAMFKRGMSSRTISDIEGITQARVVQILREIGLHKGTRTIGRPSLYSFELDGVVKRLNEGETLKSISNEMGVPYHVLRYALFSRQLITKNPRIKWTEELMQTIHNLMTVDRLTAKEVASRLNIESVNTLVTMLSKWRKRSGILPSKSRTPMDYEKVYALHKEGKSISQIAKALGRTYSGVYMALLRMAAWGRDVDI